MAARDRLTGAVRRHHVHDTVIQRLFAVGLTMQSMTKVGVKNPLFLLDEVDKMGQDFRGDPSSALLEVLDPEQNNTFYDNYLELEYDLSKVLFIATANNLANIPAALRDRLEIIELSGYAVEEKIEIAKRHLIPKQKELHGLTKTSIKFPDKSLNKMIQEYTRESGVRELDRLTAAIMRSVALQVAMEEKVAPQLSVFQKGRKQYEVVCVTDDQREDQLHPDYRQYRQPVNIRTPLVRYHLVNKEGEVHTPE